MTEQITPAEIAARMSAIDAKLNSLRYEIEKLSYASISGDQNAKIAIDAARQQQAELAGERETLELAQAQAERIENEQRQDRRKQYRRKILGQAKAVISEMRATAIQLDEKRDEVLILHRRMSELEASLRKPVVDLELSTGRTGQRPGDLSQASIDRFTAIPGGFGEAPKVATLLENAWSHVMDMEID